MKLQPDHIDKIVEIAKNYGVTKLLLFGSSLERDIESNDIDLACDGINDKRFLEFGAKLEDTFMVPVDLIPLSPETEFIKYIKKNGKFIYG